MTASPVQNIARATVALPQIRKLCESGKLFAILDACDEPDTFIKVCELGDQNLDCLYSGQARLDYANIAPYLVAVDLELFDWIDETLSGKFWGLFIGSSADRETLRRHLKQFLMVESPEGKELFFRFYDPRVLPTFLESANESELDQFFGPISMFFAELENQPRSYCQFRRHQS